MKNNPESFNMPPLTDEQIRVKIAECCGWTQNSRQCAFNDGRHQWFNTNDGCCYVECPNFTSDLNACAEMEKTLKGSEMDEYAGFLCDEIDKPEFAGQSAAFGLLHATARQRCIAFLKVKTKEEK